MYPDYLAISNAKLGDVNLFSYLLSSLKQFSWCQVFCFAKGRELGLS